jgi:hypothetical protein
MGLANKNLSGYHPIKKFHYPLKPMQTSKCFAFVFLCILFQIALSQQYIRTNHVVPPETVKTISKNSIKDDKNGITDFSYPKYGSRPNPPDCTFVNPFGECITVNGTFSNGCKYMDAYSQCTPYDSGDLQEYRSGILVDGNFAVSFGQNPKYQSLPNGPISFTFFTKGRSGFSTICLSQDGIDYDIGYCFVAQSSNNVVKITRYGKLSSLTLSSNTDGILVPNLSQGETILVDNHTTLTKMNGIYGLRFLNLQNVFTFYPGDTYPHYSKFQIVLSNTVQTLFNSRPYVFMAYSLYGNPSLPLIYTDKTYFPLNLTDSYPLSVSPAGWNFVFHRFEAMDLILWCVFNLVYLMFFIVTICFSHKSPLSTRGVYPILAIFLQWVNHFSCLVHYFQFLGTVHGMPYFASLRFTSLFMLIINSLIELVRFVILESIHRKSVLKQNVKTLSVFIHPILEIVVFVGMFVVVYLVVLALGFIPVPLPFDMDFIFLWCVIGCFVIKFLVTVVVGIIEIGMDSIHEKPKDIVIHLYTKDNFWFRFQFYVLDPLVFLIVITGFCIHSFVLVPPIYSVVMYGLFCKDVLFVLFVTIAKILRESRYSKPTNDSLLEFVSVPLNHEKFMEFCIAEWCAQDLMFLDDVMAFSKWSGDEKKTHHDIARSIVAFYLKSDASLRVHVAKAKVATLMEKLDSANVADELPRDLFKDVLNDSVANLGVAYSRFVHSRFDTELSHLKEFELRLNPKKRDNGGGVTPGESGGSDQEIARFRDEMNKRLEAMEEENRMRNDRLQESIVGRIEDLAEHVKETTDSKFDNLIKNIQNGRLQLE